MIEKIMKKIKNNKLILIFLFVLLIFLFNRIHITQANFLENLWKNLIPNFLENQTPTKSEIQNKNNQNSEEISIYKPVVDYENAVIEAVKRVSNSVVSITVSKNVPIIESCPANPFNNNIPPEFFKFFGDNFFDFYVPCQKGEKLKEIGSGSGFIISSDGLILTNKHVVLDTKASYTVLTNDGKKYDAQVLARDPLLDIAILKINANNLPVAPLGDSSNLQLGQTAIAIGNALGEFRNTVSVGVISGLARTVTAGDEIGSYTETIKNVIQTDAAINPGNSGGPLINLKGEVIGINTAIASGAENIGFAIPINQVKSSIESFKIKGKIERPFLGIRYVILNKEIAKQKKLTVDYGALIDGDNKNEAVIKNSPAQKAGILKGDIILEINGQKIDENNSLADIVGQYKPGDEINLKILRNNKEINIKVKLESYPEDINN
ncbi:MAG: trypsin-like peptidase domain-containing protein [Patescibacteria group bacterium]|nr:trypsin-like peptidase domain-containing protein [Patescibacteria group bacterium]